MNQLLIAVPVHGPGQHIAAFSTSSVLPDLMTGDRVWCRKGATQGLRTLHHVEYWGESTSIAGGIATLVTPSAPDFPYLRHPLAWDPFYALSVTINGDLAQLAETMGAEPSVAYKRAAVSHDEFAGNIEIAVHARAPVAYLRGMLNCVAMVPNGTPVVVTIAHEGRQPVRIVSQVFGCRCALNAPLPPRNIAVDGLDPETQHAIDNARSMPLPAAVMGIVE